MRYDEELYQVKTSSLLKMSEMDKLYKHNTFANTIEEHRLYILIFSSYGSTNYGKHQNGASPAVYIPELSPAKQVIENPRAWTFSPR